MSLTLVSIIYLASLTVIVLAAFVAALHSEIPIKGMGQILLGGVAVFALLGFEYTPRQWITGLLACLACLLIVCYRRWRLHVREQRRLAALRCRRATDRAPIVTKPEGGEDARIG